MTQVELNIHDSGIRPITEKKSTSPFRYLLANRDFRLLWIGEAISLLGDQFHMIALPWLVLQLTGDAFMMGIVLALAAVPRAIFMLVGGAITDRYSSRNVMLLSNLARMVLVIILSATILTGNIEMWLIYLISLLFGLADAFYFPASQSIVPSLVSKTLLHSANAIVQGTVQISVFLGPMIAGILISLLSTSTPTVDGVPGMTGIGIAFGFDALTFVVSAMTLWMMSNTFTTDKMDDNNREQSILSSIRDGFSYIRHDGLLSKVFIVSVGINFLVNGPLTVGIPVLADTQYPEGAAAFGIIISGFGGGALLGIIMAGALPRPKPAYMGTLIMLAVSTLGLAEVVLVATHSTALATLAVAVAGAGNGYINVMFFTWIQSVTPANMIGRMMSVFMFAGAGTAPIGHAMTGALLTISPLLTFAGAGILVIALAAYMLRDKDIKRMGYAMVGETVQA
jgi:predicted MFS family arabinose efflux permease